MDSAIMFGKGQVELLRGQMRGLDASTVRQFDTAKRCRRSIISSDLNRPAMRCADGEGVMALCGRSGEGSTAIK